jgi:Zn-dependent membrane protease YugP
MLADPLFWIFVLPGLLLGAYAQSRIKINIAKYSQIRTQDGITGAQVARRLLDSEGLQAVAIESTPGMLSDHYDPRSKILRLSQQVYFAPSVAAAGIAAHEAGHALQDAVDYFPLEAANAHRSPSAVSFANRALVVYRRSDAAVYRPGMGRGASLRLILRLCFNYATGRIQCQRKGAKIIGGSRYHPGQ